MANRSKAMSILQEEAELQEIVRLVGQDALSASDRMTLETARMIREDFLQQNAFINEDAYSSYGKQYRLLDLVLQYDNLCRAALDKGAELQPLFDIPQREAIGRAKMVDQEAYAAAFDEILEKMKAEIDEVVRGGEEQ
jgi:V/A-type H+-transporting ATPase subunit A